MADSDNESGGHNSGGTAGNSELSSAREQDRFLPIANVSRIMKKALPTNAKISKEAKETVQECVSEFISFITGEASDKCRREKRKTINGDDLLWAMSTLGFEEYVDPLRLYLQNFREVDGDRIVASFSSSAQSQQMKGAAASTAENGGGGLYVGGGFMMMGQQIYGSSPSRMYQSHNHRMAAGKGNWVAGGSAGGSGGGGNSSSSSTNIERQGRV